MTPPDRTLKFVRLEQIEAYKAMGWVDLRCLDGTPHAQWSTLMEYHGPDREHPPMSPPND